MNFGILLLQGRLEQLRCNELWFYY